MKNYLIIADDLITIDDSINNILSENSLSSENVIKYDLCTSYIENVIEELNTYGLFSENKIVVVDASLMLSTEKKKSELIQDESLLEKYIENPNPLNSLILITDKVDERKKIVKSLKKNLNVIDKKLSIEDKIKKNLDDYKMSIININYLISCLNNDNERILNELEKLKLYKIDEKEITKEDIDNIVIKEFNDDIFTLINSILNRDINKSFEIYNSLLSRGEEISKIVITVLDQFRLIYKTKILINDKKTKEEITSLFNIHPYRVKLAIEQSYSFTMEELEKYIRELGLIDISIKTGKNANKYGFDIFLLGINVE